jgi:hypothetical protein
VTKMENEQRRENAAIGQDGMKDPNAFDERCFGPREGLKNVGANVKALMEHPIFSVNADSHCDLGEMKANIMLAYRHIEDARMRLGKAVQAYGGGASCYPR